MFRLIIKWDLVSIFTSRITRIPPLSYEWKKERKKKGGGEKCGADAYEKHRNNRTRRCRLFPSGFGNDARRATRFIIPQNGPKTSPNTWRREFSLLAERKHTENFYRFLHVEAGPGRNQRVNNFTRRRVSGGAGWRSSPAVDEKLQRREARTPFRDRLSRAN